MSGQISSSKLGYGSLQQCGVWIHLDIATVTVVMWWHDCLILWRFGLALADRYKQGLQIMLSSSRRGLDGRVGPVRRRLKILRILLLRRLIVEVSTNIYADACTRRSNVLHG